MASTVSASVKYTIIMVLEPGHNEFVRYLQALNRLFSERGEPFETVLIANGAENLLAAKRDELKRLNQPIKCFFSKRLTTEAVCIKIGLRESAGEEVFVTGAYQQISDNSIREMLQSIEGGQDAVIAWRQDRVDPWFNRLQSGVFNCTVRLITKTKFRDLSCETKLFKRRVLEDIEIYNGMFRFSPILAAMRGYKVIEIKSKHFEERGKIGFYSVGDYATRVTEIFTLFFNTRFARKPLRFFNSVGAIFIVLGLTTFIYVAAQKLAWGVQMGGRPVLLLGILFLVVGAQMASVGLLGEIVAFTHGRHKRENIVEKVV